MVDYFRHLALRSLQPQAVIQPRLAGRYEPPQTGGLIWATGPEMEIEVNEDQEAERQPGVAGHRVRRAPKGQPLAFQPTPGITQADQMAEPVLRPAAGHSPLREVSSEVEEVQHSSASVRSPRREVEPAPPKPPEGEQPQDESRQAPPPATLQPAEATPVEMRPPLGRETALQPEAAPAPPRLELMPALAPAPPPERLDSGSKAHGLAAVEPPAAVNITIGRIEVRAASISKPASPERKSRTAALVMDLEEYRKKRNGGGG